MWLSNIKRAFNYRLPNAWFGADFLTPPDQPRDHSGSHSRRVPPAEYGPISGSPIIGLYQFKSGPVLQHFNNSVGSFNVSQPLPIRLAVSWLKRGRLNVLRSEERRVG